MTRPALLVLGLLLGLAAAWNLLQLGLEVLSLGDEAFWLALTGGGSAAALKLGTKDRDRV